jgi:hypothetical protein
MIDTASNSLLLNEVAKLAARVEYCRQMFFPSRKSKILFKSQRQICAEGAGGKRSNPHENRLCQNAASPRDKR